MVSRKKYATISVDVERINSEGEDIKMYLEYYLLEDNYYNEEIQNIKTFGIEVVKKEIIDDKIINIEKESAQHLVLDKNTAQRLLDNLAHNTVTPIGFFDVLDNLIGVYY